MTPHGVNELRRTLNLESIPIEQMDKVNTSFFDTSIKLSQKDCSGILPVSKAEYGNLKNLDKNKYMVLRKEDFESLKQMAGKNADESFKDKYLRSESNLASLT